MKMVSSRSDSRPIHPDTGAPIGPLPQPGYYPGFKTLDQQNAWDSATREVVLNRVRNVPPIRFFSPAQARLLQEVCDRILPQDDRDDEHKIPIVPQIDKRLYENIHDGYQYDDMPADREAFQLGLQGIETMTREQYGCGFLEIGPGEQEQILRSLHDGNPKGAHEVWTQMPVHRFWTLLVTECADAYYAHPWAWDEIGFGGPAYPRAYMRLEHGEPEPWEVRERRYLWAPPQNSQSGENQPVASSEEQFGSPGQGGTH